MQRMNYLSNHTIHLQFMHCPLERDLMHLKQINLPSHLFTSTYKSVFECAVKLLYMYCYSNCNFNCMVNFLIFCSFFLLLDINFRFLFLSTQPNASLQAKKKCPLHLHEYNRSIVPNTCIIVVPNLCRVFLCTPKSIRLRIQRKKRE